MRQRAGAGMTPNRTARLFEPPLSAICPPGRSVTNEKVIRALDVSILYLYVTRMGTIQDARNILTDAEVQLRQLIERGLREQRYEDIAEIAGLAQGIAQLLRVRVPAHCESAISTPRASPASTKNMPAKPARTGYPRFERDGDRLVKVGWSKKNKSSYEHRAPKDAVIAFARHLLGSVSEGKPFVVESLLPVPDVVSGGELPAYQVYLVLAWFRREGIVEKKGRDGYVLRGGSLDNDVMDKIWSGLPERSL